MKEKNTNKINTVGELISRLSKFPPECELILYWKGSVCDMTAVNVHQVGKFVDGKQQLTNQVQITTV